MIDFGLADAVDAETIGPPGERTFRIRARAGVNHASLWMEKEQLSALGRALSQVLAERSSERGKASQPAPEMGDFPQDVDVDMRIARMGLDFEAEREHVVVLADDSEAVERGDTPAFRVEITRAMALALIESIPKIVGAGRPLCPLCGQALEGDGQHFCPGTNGHSDEPIPEATEDVDEQDDEEAQR